MRYVSVRVQGLSCTLDSGIINSDLTARTEIKTRIYGGKNHGRFKTSISLDPVYSKNEKNNTITCGIGALLFLTKNNPFISIDFSSITPERTSFRKIDIPPKILESPKWLVGGRQRWYFYEALQACRKAHCGTIRLPTGSGKSFIELVLAYNLMRQIE